MALKVRAATAAVRRLTRDALDLVFIVGLPICLIVFVTTRFVHLPAHMPARVHTCVRVFLEPAHLATSAMQCLLANQSWPCKHWTWSMPVGPAAKAPLFCPRQAQKVLLNFFSSQPLWELFRLFLPVLPWFALPRLAVPYPTLPYNARS